MERSVSMRLKWVQLYEETMDAGLACRRCGISRSTLRKWYQRFQELGIDGLSDQSKSHIIVLIRRLRLRLKL